MGWAYFSDLGVGARPMGMGGAYTGIADDANAPFFNTAGLTQLGQREFTAMYSMLYAGLDPVLYTGEKDQLGYHSMGFVQPIRKNIDAIAVSWLLFNSELYDENEFVMSYARRIYTSNLKFPRVSAGLNVKILNLRIASNEYTQRDPDLSRRGLSKTDATVDVNMLVNFTQRFHLGLMAANVRPVNMGVLQDEEIPVKFAIGLAYREGNTLQLVDVSWRNSLLNEHHDVNLKLGIEHWLFKRQMGIRAGYNIKSLSAGASYRYRYEEYELQLDYAFIYPLTSIIDTLGTHRFALSVRL